MRIFVVVNQVNEIGFRQTTALLIGAMVRRKHEVWIANVDAFSAFAGADQTTVFARAIKMPWSGDCQSVQVQSHTRSETVSSLERLGSDDVIMIRTNPGRDIQRTQIHESFLHLCCAAEATGVRVVNSPENLRYFASKSALLSVAPEFRPTMVVTGDLQQMLDFIDNAPADCVAKPLFGSRGENVMRISKSDKDLKAKLSATFGTSQIVLQHFVSAEHLGDKRVVVVNGEILAVKGHIAGIERRPAVNDFRANLHAGGSAHQLTLSKDALTAVQCAAWLLNESGIWLAGIDLIGDKIIEFNVFSTGGLYDAIQFSGIAFDDLVIEKLFG